MSIICGYLSDSSPKAELDVSLRSREFKSGWLGSGVRVKSRTVSNHKYHEVNRLLPDGAELAGLSCLCGALGCYPMKADMDLYSFVHLVAIHTGSLLSDALLYS